MSYKIVLRTVRNKKKGFNIHQKSGKVICTYLLYSHTFDLNINVKFTCYTFFLELKSPISIYIFTEGYLEHQSSEPLSIINPISHGQGYI